MRQDKVSLTLGHWMERPEKRGKYTAYGQQKPDKMASCPEILGSPIQDQRISSIITRTEREPQLEGQEWSRPVHFEYKSFQVSAVVSRATSNPHSLLSYSGAGIASQTRRETRPCSQPAFPQSWRANYRPWKTLLHLTTFFP